MALPPELLARIDAAKPRYAVLTQDEFLQLEAYLSVRHRDYYSASRVVAHRRQFGRSAEWEGVIRRREDREHLREVLDYNRRLRAASPAESPDWDFVAGDRGQEAVIAMLELQDAGKPTTSKAIAEHAYGHEEEANAVRKALAPLKAQGFVRSGRGSAGGYRLTANGVQLAKKLKRRMEDDSNGNNGDAH